MGGDGGSIPKRDDLVRSKKRPERADRDAANSALWRHCALSQDPLRQPIVGCQLGRLYNKESIITKLLAKKDKQDPSPQSQQPIGVADHINKLRDVRELQLSVTHSNGTRDSNAAGSSGGSSGPEMFYCPVTGLEMSGLHQFVFLWPCGCVFSKKALDAVQDPLCMQCTTPFNPADVILINPQSKSDVEASQERLKQYRLNSAQAKGKKRPRPAPGSDIPTDQGSAPKKSAEPDKKQSPPSTECVSEPPVPIQESSKVSSVYKSLFTTSEEARRQPKAHWVTYNPLYFR